MNTSGQPTDPGMLFSAEAIRMAEDLKYRFIRRIKDDSLIMARRAGRKTVMERDVRAALDGFDAREIGFVEVDE